MISWADVKAELESRTATSIYYGRFVTLLHHWAKRNAPDFDAAKRFREQGCVWLSDDEAQRFIRWAEKLDKSCFISYPIPVLWQRKQIGKLTYNWH